MPYRLFFVRFTLAFVLFVVGSMCRPQATATAQSTLDEVYQRFSAAYDRLDADAVASLYTEEAQYLTPSSDRPIRQGRAAIKQSFEAFFNSIRDRQAALDISFRIVDRSISGDLAYDVGYYKLVVSYPEDPAKEPSTSAGKFVVVAKKQADGTWQFHVDGYSSTPVAAFDEAEDLR